MMDESTYGGSSLMNSQKYLADHVKSSGSGMPETEAETNDEEGKLYICKLPVAYS